ncbi:hypothetical protein ACFQU2_12860 [Siccirubricoccus deserti]
MAKALLHAVPTATDAPAIRRIGLHDLREALARGLMISLPPRPS